MTSKQFCLLLVAVQSCLALVSSNLAAEGVDFDQVLSRYRQILLELPVPEAAVVERLIEDQTQEGEWPRINYEDKHPASFGPKEHMANVRTLALAFESEQSAWKGSAKLKRAIERGLDDWFQNHYRSTNWWHNEIGVPQGMRDIVVLLGPHLDPKRREQALKVIGQCRLSGSGANLLWSGELTIHRACLTRNRGEFVGAVDKVWGEVKVGGASGIQEDWSFYQHGARSQSFGYGRSYLDMAVNLAWQLRCTERAMPVEKQAILSNFILEGLEWMSRGTYTPPGTIDRVVSRQDAGERGKLVPVLRRWAEVDPSHRAELKRFIAHQEGNADRPLGFRYFPRAELAAYHRPGGSIFLKLLSDRTLPTESIIGENLKGVPYLHCGDHYAVRTGREYTDLAPILQWNRLAGLTTPAQDLRQLRKAFVGGVGNDRSGLAAMKYIRTVEGREVIRLRKSWFFHDDYMICLLADVGHSTDAARDGRDPLGADAVVTSVEQCRLQGAVVVAEKSESSTMPSRKQSVAPGTHRFKNVAWVLHNSIGYLSLDDTAWNVYIGEARGSWSAINSRYHDPNESVVENVLRIQIPHGSEQSPQGYAIVLGGDRESIDALARAALARAAKRRDNSGRFIQRRPSNGIVLRARPPARRCIAGRLGSEPALPGDVESRRPVVVRPHATRSVDGIGLEWYSSGSGASCPRKIVAPASRP